LIGAKVKLSAVIAGFVVSGATYALIVFKEGAAEVVTIGQALCEALL